MGWLRQNTLKGRPGHITAISDDFKARIQKKTGWFNEEKKRRLKLRTVARRRVLQIFPDAPLELLTQPSMSHLGITLLAVSSAFAMELLKSFPVYSITVTSLCADDASSQKAKRKRLILGPP